jgi:hypothetical protein
MTAPPDDGTTPAAKDPSFRGDQEGDFAMADDDADPAGVGPNDEAPSGAFVARIWHDDRGLRARVRHTVDLSDAEQVATIRGASDQVLPDLVGRFRRWAEDFVADDDEPSQRGDGAMTEQ